MAQITRLTIDVPSGYASTEVGSFVAQLDDQLRRLTIDTRGLTPADLAWQPVSGMNTIGMLLAHLAIVEVFWTCAIIEDLQREAADLRIREVLGIGSDDDGLPLPVNGAPPGALAGKDLAFFDDLLARAREHVKRIAKPVPGAQLTRMFTRTRPNGEVREIEMRWMLYHVLEHFAGHYGQVLLLKHARAAMSGGSAKAKPAAPERGAAAKRAAKAKRGAKPKPAAKPKRAAKAKRGAKSKPAATPRRATKPKPAAKKQGNRVKAGARKKSKQRR